MTFFSLSIMQPYFFPYLGYFSLIRHTDRFVVFDTVQYIDKGWINRNRILSQSKEGVAYITVPVVKASRDMLIKDTKIDHSQKWKAKILGQLAFYKKKAPFYYKTISLVKEILDFETDYISELNVYALEKTCQHIGIEFNYCVFSKNTYGINAVNAPDEWALEISKKLKANTYINPPGGKSLFDKEKYDKANIKLQFLKINLIPYQNTKDKFIEGLSILDVLMFNDTDIVKVMLENYELD